jgi:hypothetical protein
MAGCDGDEADHDSGLGARLPTQLLQLAQRVTGGFDDGRRTISEGFAELDRQGGHVKTPSQVTAPPADLGGGIRQRKDNVIGLQRPQSGKGTQSARPHLAGRVGKRRTSAFLIARVTRNSSGAPALGAGR